MSKWEPMQMNGHKKTLSLKLNLATIGMILLVAVGVLYISFQVYSSRLKAMYCRNAEKAAASAADLMNPELIENIIRWVDTDEFREISAKAVQAENPEIIREWMRTKPTAAFSEEELETMREDPFYAENQDYLSLIFDYDMAVSLLDFIRNQEDITYVYIQYMKDGVTRNLLETEEDILLTGTEEEALPEFAEYGDNERVPATIYKSRFGWLCSAYEPLVNPETGETVASVGVDIDMSRMVRELTGFLISCLIFIFLLTAVCIAVNVYLINRIAVKPIRILTSGAASFAGGDGGCTREDVISADIHSEDEINDLYNEIRRMQNRIVDYTENLADITAERERIGTELRLASAIQKAMLPDRFPAFPERKEFSLFASMDPAKDVGGDFYDYFLIDRDHLGLVIADVSGKGIPAALFMMASMIQIRDQMTTGKSPAEVLKTVNSEICCRNRAEMFVTVWIGILDIRTGVMTCANAGHEYPAVLEADGSCRLFKDKHGFVLGGMEGMEYRDYEIRLKPGAGLMVYTDGVTEATREDHTLYGTERLIQALNGAESRDPENLIRAVRRDVDTFVDGAEQFDDMTMLCVVYHGTGAEP